MTQELYQKLRACIDNYALGFPETKSGIEMKILKHLFTPEEASLYLHLTLGLEPVETIAQRAGISAEKSAQVLKTMTDKGLTFPKKMENKTLYAAAPFMHGIFENNAWKQDDVALAEMMEEYITGEYKAKGKALRTVPINASLKEQKTVALYDDVTDIIKSKEKIGVMPCACDRHMQVLNKACGRPNEVCLGFDFYADYCIEGLGVGRWIDQAEALEILKKADDAGLVHQTGGDNQATECICSCCPDCCESLRAIKRFPKPARLAGSNYQAQHIEENCTQCEACIDRCPMDALTMADDGLSLNEDRCIGCGLCTTGCPSDALELVLKEPDFQTGPLPPEQTIFMKPSRDFEKDAQQWT